MVDELVVLRPHHGGLLLSEVEPSRLGEEVAQGTVLGRVFSPYTFEELETVTLHLRPDAPRARARAGDEGRPGDYGFMVANAATASPLDG